MNTHSNTVSAGPEAGQAKPVIFCADDFGMSDGVNAGILALAQAGRLSAVSCMSRGPAFRREAQILGALPAVAKGLHLNLTEALEGGEFVQPLGRLIRNAFSRRLDPATIRHEIATQLDAFEAALAQPPDYVDGHQHVHQFPVVRDCLIELLQQRYGHRRPWLRGTFRGPQPGVPVALQAKAAVIAWLGAHGLRRLAQGHGFRLSPHLLGVYGFAGGAEAYTGLLAAWIRAAAPNDVLMCHPGRGVVAGDVLGAQRQAEYIVLAGPEFPVLLQRHGACVATPPFF